MTLKTTFIVSLAVSTLAFGVQAALGMSDAADRAQQAAVSSYPDAVERAVFAKENSRSAAVTAYPDAVERAVAAREEPSSGPLPGHVDRYELDLPNGPLAAPTTGSGTEIEWPQLGIGFAFGILSVIGLILAVRFTRGRPLVHG